MIFCSLVIAVITATLVTMAIFIFEDYGYSIFLGAPSFAGAAVTLLYGRGRALSLKDVFGVTSLTGLFVLSSLLIAGTEGVVCIAMAVPVCLPLAWIGGFVALAVRRTFRRAGQSPMASLVIFLPLVAGMALEDSAHLQPQLREVSTSMTVHADAMTTWDVVVAFPPITSELTFPFTVGIAYPQSASIEGSGVGAIRKCTFSTGSFIEPITRWEAGRLLEFSVSSNPPPLEELSFYELLELPHLHGTFESERGRFLLEETGPGEIRITGTTWYRQKLWPQAYWNRLADPLIHKIHLRVLKHIKEVAESEMARPSSLRSYSSSQSPGGEL